MYYQTVKIKIFANINTVAVNEAGVYFNVSLGEGHSIVYIYDLQKE